MLERLNQALDHLEACLDREVDVAEAARIAAVSEYHFRRLFSALAGMPLPVYVRRRRMTLAAAEVLAGERTVLDVAVRYGYGSGEAFARAFRIVARKARVPLVHEGVNTAAAAHLENLEERAIVRMKELADREPTVLQTSMCLQVEDRACRRILSDPSCP